MIKFFAVATVLAALVGAAGYASVAPTNANAASFNRCSNLHVDLTVTTQELNEGHFGVASVGFRHLARDFRAVGKPTDAKLAADSAYFLRMAGLGEKVPAGTFKLIRRSLHYMSIDRAQLCGRI